MKSPCTDADFIRLFSELGPTELSKRLKITTKNIHWRRRILEVKIGRPIHGPNHIRRYATHLPLHPQRVEIDIDDGYVLVGSDAHIWPGPTSTAMRAFILFCKEYRPKVVVLNGDVMDFPQISRHQRIGWEQLPTVQQEIEAAQDTLSKIEKATFKARKVWTLGNHDARFESRIANTAPEYAKVHGVHLKDHFPLWDCGWSCWVNDVVIKHRFKGGIHATHNNTIWSGKSIVTGHLHSAKVTPFTDYNGDRYGVDTGCLADVSAKPFIDYTEDNPLNWRSGFAVLKFKDGRLLPPELVLVWGADHVVFRGEVLKI